MRILFYVSVSKHCLHGGVLYDSILSEYRSVSVTRTCTERYDAIARDIVWLLDTCRQWEGNKFVEGVDGHVPGVESMRLPYCNRGDEMTWYTYGVCCPGRLS